MATKQKSKKIEQKCNNITFEASSINSTVIKEMLFRDPEAEEEEEDGPVVFICGKCRMIVGDSLSWDGSEESLNQIRLKRVTDNVLLGNESRVHEEGKRYSCLIVDLICRGCCKVIGMVYTSTPRKLDHKRFTFCLDVAQIDSYVLGSANNKLAAEGTKEQPATLEDKEAVEQQLTEMKMLVMTMAQRMEEIELGLTGGV
ncbi:protein Mis18-alpha [Salarias fasciatus]|uniref:protein Mis18-alpha n=1 Tax=Salarias fasciatus TaxID=181472 RepID=UPI0011768A30|nr:protein Mis18-alpha [Salarias fasciatus]